MDSGGHHNGGGSEAACGADRNAAGDGATPAKVPRLEDSTDCSAHHTELGDLSSFQILKTLKEDVHAKTICVHGRIGRSADASKEEMECENAILILEKTPFGKESLDEIISGKTALRKIFNNDIYGTYHALPVPEANSLRATLIYPATEKHMDKYSSHENVIITETAEDYRDITLPWIESEAFSVQWVYNILDKKQESEFIICEDADPVSGFLLLPDLKWDRKQVDNLYVCGIAHARNIKSLRDLRAEHLPLLEKLLTIGTKGITEKYGLPANKIRAYLHYQPTYYHLHVHYNHLKFTAPGSNVIGAHLLTDIIDNIRLFPDYYQQKTLTFSLATNSKLYALYKAAGRV